MKIVVLCGGNSSEREVSINSGYNVCKALRSMGDNAILIDAFFGTDDLDIFEKSADNYDVLAARDEIQSKSGLVDEIYKERKTFWGHNTMEICMKSDIVFIALHGMNGEDGRCQAAFDLRGVKYTGSGHVASAIGMDKGITKQIFEYKNVPTAKSVWIKEYDETALDKIGMNVPVVVKACNGGSSVGVVLVMDESEYDDALKECFKYDNHVLVEEYIKGREFSVGVIENKALPVVEIIPKCGWYDYKNKYQNGATDDVCPAKLSEELTKKIQKAAEDAYKAIGCEAYARVDVIMDENENMYCLEVNTLPGMTNTSLVPIEASVIGIDFPHLCKKLIDVSLKKYEE